MCTEYFEYTTVFALLLVLVLVGCSRRRVTVGSGTLFVKDRNEHTALPVPTIQLGLLGCAVNDEATPSKFTAELSVTRSLSRTQDPHLPAGA